MSFLAPTPSLSPATKRSSAGIASFGFSWFVAVWPRKPKFTPIGFPWILSSESRLMNGLHGALAYNLRRAFNIMFPGPMIAALRESHRPDPPYRARTAALRIDKDRCAPEKSRNAQSVPPTAPIASAATFRTVCKNSAAALRRLYSCPINSKAASKDGAPCQTLSASHSARF
jgi:hypothetical protein